MSDLTPRGIISGTIYRGGGGGVTDYDDLTNRPKINNITLTGNKTTQDLGLADPDDIPIIGINLTPTALYRAETITLNGVVYQLKYEDFEGTDGLDDGSNGLVPAPSAADQGKFLGASGSWESITGVRVNKLYSNIINSIGTYTLNDSIENYEFILFITAYTNGEGNPVVGSNFAPSEYLRTIYTNNNSEYSVWIDGGNNDRASVCVFHNSTEFYVSKASVEDAIIGIYGIKI